jgi:phosphonoacetaldehyde hydrolase
LPEATVADIRARATAEMAAAGADVVIDGIADLVGAVDAIERRIAAGERPGGGKSNVKG